MSCQHPIFAIQKHDAKKLHFDFFLEIEGVLKSWALPEGIALNSGETRLAIPINDQPLDFADFEGVIPNHEYGSGTVLLWDSGTYQNLMITEGKEVPMKKCLENGQIEVKLNGKRLSEKFILVKSEEKRLEENWYFIKMDENDQELTLSSDSPVRSIKTGRTLDQIRRETSSED